MSAVLAGGVGLSAVAAPSAVRRPGARTRQANGVVAAQTMAGKREGAVEEEQGLEALPNPTQPSRMLTGCGSRRGLGRRRRLVSGLGGRRRLVSRGRVGCSAAARCEDKAS